MDRKRRVRRIRRFIFVGMPILLLTFATLSVVLTVRSVKLHRSLVQAREELNAYMEAQSEWEYTRLRDTADAEDTETAEVLSDEGAVSVEGDTETPTAREIPSLSKAEVDSLTLGNEELYDGYRKVYLTFDDGPSINTSAILDILAKYDVKATFFVLRKDGANNEKLYRRIADEGHTLGMHSNTHEYSVVYGGEEAFMEDTTSLRDFLYMVTGVESNYYRFPGGSSNRVSVVPMEVYGELLHDNGIEYYDWNVSAKDAVVPMPSADQIYWNVRSGLSDHEEAIILFHDTASKTSTVQALPRIIEYIQSLDNTVILPITETTNPIQHLRVQDNK
ncbi:MAG: polysaccharide deacetylase [Lachnospiraceae bacterium]|nr:polysaccharide deacetylase [Lachnospiraceae bacterium]